VYVYASTRSTCPFANDTSSQNRFLVAFLGYRLKSAQLKLKAGIQSFAFSLCSLLGTGTARPRGWNATWTPSMKCLFAQGDCLRVAVASAMHPAHHHFACVSHPFPTFASCPSCPNHYAGPISLAQRLDSPIGSQAGGLIFASSHMFECDYVNSQGQVGQLSIRTSIHCHFLLSFRLPSENPFKAASYQTGFGYGRASSSEYSRWSNNKVGASASRFSAVEPTHSGLASIRSRLSVPSFPSPISGCASETTGRLTDYQYSKSR
jgi:hypothetical protein